MTGARTSLRRRILVGLVGYAALLSLAVVVHGIIVNEQAEQLVWQTLLQSELNHYVERLHADPGYHWIDTRTISLYGTQLDSRPMPAVLAALEPGVHDEVMVDGDERVVLVSDVDGRRLALSLDISTLEDREFDLALTVAGSALTLLVVLGLLAVWGVDRLLRPLSKLAQDIGQLQPDRAAQRLDIAPGAGSELTVIARALNDYLQRNARFVERERAFIDSTSHELRTPVAVIVGAGELGIAHADDPLVVRRQLARIVRTARDVEQLISLLLLLAKDPARMAAVSERVALDQWLPTIVEDHRHLVGDKDLALVVGVLPHAELVAPLQIVQTAIGTLLRNAIENSDRGQILIDLRADATVVIHDPGHGMTPEEIAAIYARMARGSEAGRDGGGIGLDLVARLCEHLGWALSFDSDAGRGTTTTLRFAAPPLASTTLPL